MLYIIDIFTVDLASLHSQTPKHVLITGAPSLLAKLVGKNSIHQVVGVTMYPSRLSYGGYRLQSYTAGLSPER